MDETTITFKIDKELKEKLDNTRKQLTPRESQQYFINMCIIERLRSLDAID